MTAQKARGVLLLLAVGIAAGVFIDEWVRAKHQVTPPPRPLNVPSSATWDGGEDGGTWFACTRQAYLKYRCTVFADTTGIKISEGLYGFVPEDSSGRLDPVTWLSDTEIVVRGARLVRIP